MSCGVGHRCGSDPELLWLWRRPAAIAPIRPLAWEPPCAGWEAALEKARKTKNIYIYIYAPKERRLSIPLYVLKYFNISCGGNR